MSKLPFVIKFFALFALLTVLLIYPVAVLHAAPEGGEKKAEAPSGGEKKEGEGKKEGGKKDDKSISGGRFDGDPMYVHLQPFILPVVTEKGAEQIVTLIVDLRVKDGRAANNIQDNMPRVKDAMMQELYGGLGSGDLRQGALVDVAGVRRKIFQAVTRVLGEGAIEEVLIQAIAQRKL